VKVVYVAGPFRGKDHYEIHTNICNAEALALKVWRLGAVALCPHLNTAHFQNAAPDDVWLDGDLELLRRCDAVIMTADWQRSSGATAEHAFAKQHGIPVFYSIYALQDWLLASRPPVAESSPAA
jgi:nucleoside 2-deoxyribosyltransferase